MFKTSNQKHFKNVILSAMGTAFAKNSSLAEKMVMIQVIADFSTRNAKLIKINLMIFIFRPRLLIQMEPSQLLFILDLAVPTGKILIFLTITK